MRRFLLGAMCAALLASPAAAQDCTASGSRAQAGTLAAPGPPCKSKADTKEKPTKLPDTPAFGNGKSNFYIGGSIGTEMSIHRR
ncbi:MAG: hypothetical protein QOD74_406 [Variibacter sp.]|nr:hypothetical protein [Variibacter sp.]